MAAGRHHRERVAALRVGGRGEAAVEVDRHAGRAALVGLADAVAVLVEEHHAREPPAARAAAQAERLVRHPRALLVAQAEQHALVVLRRGELAARDHRQRVEAGDASLERGGPVAREGPGRRGTHVHVVLRAGGRLDAAIHHARIPQPVGEERAVRRDPEARAVGAQAQGAFAREGEGGANGARIPAPAIPGSTRTCRWCCRRRPWRCRGTW